MRGPVDDVEDADHREQRGVLLQADEVVQQRRDDAPDGLGDDDVAQRLGVGQAEGAGRRRLAPVDALEPGAVHLRDVGAVDQRERQHGEPEPLAVAAEVEKRGSSASGKPNTTMYSTSRVGKPRKRSA